MSQKLANETRPETIDAIDPRTLRTLHEQAAGNFGAALSTMLRCPVEVNLASVESISYGQFVQSLESPSCFHVLKAEPLADRLMLDIDTAILYPMLDRMLGGGAEDESPPRRAPSDIELPLVARITRLFLDELHAAWQKILDMTFDVLQVESHPRFLRVLPSDEPVAAIGFQLKVGNSIGMMRLCLPCRAIQQINDRRAETKNLSAAASAESSGAAECDAAVDVTVTLATTTLSAAELRTLRPGDIIVTETDAEEPLSVAVGGGPHFRAKPGACRGRKAIMLSEEP
jgi:flagellar motor switch protein FliM